MAKDKRKKGCPNSNCEINQKQIKYSAEDNFCPKCGYQLVYVCANKGCYKKIDDSDPKHRICASCEAEKAEKDDKAKAAGKKALGVAGGAVLAVLAAAGEELKKPALELAKAVGKGTADRIADVGKKAIKAIGEAVLKK